MGEQSAPPDTDAAHVPSKPTNPPCSQHSRPTLRSPLLPLWTGKNSIATSMRLSDPTTTAVAVPPCRVLPVLLLELLLPLLPSLRTLLRPRRLRWVPIRDFLYSSPPRLPSARETLSHGQTTRLDHIMLSSTRMPSQLA